MSKQIWDSCLQREIPFEMLDLASHPTPSDLEKRLGKELVDVYFKTCSPIEKIFFGRDKSLKGPEGRQTTMCKNSEDRMPLKTDCLKALTHRGIMEIGRKIEEKIIIQQQEVVDAAVKEAQELERFEADLRIKYHVEDAVKKLNEEWQQRYDELLKNHESEMEDLMRVVESGRRVFCEFMAKKCGEEIDKHVVKAVADEKLKMEEAFTKKLNDELSQQHVQFEQSMEVTLNNLVANDTSKMSELRNHCLKALDLQSHMMMCRQITELIHLMSVEKSHWRRRFKDLRDEYENKIVTLSTQLASFVDELSQEYRSKSIIIALWRKFFKSLSGIDVNELSECETRIFDEFQRIQTDLIENFDDNSSRVFIIHENDEEEERKSQDNQVNDDDDDDDDDDNENDSNRKINNCIQFESLRRDSTVAVNWQQCPNESSSIDDIFMSSIYQRMSQADAHGDIPISKIASSIVAMVRECNNDDDEKLVDMIVALLEKGNIKDDTMSCILTLPKTESLQIRDSREIIGKRLSIQSQSIDSHHHLLGVADSLEILSKRTSKNNEDDEIKEIYVESADEKGECISQNESPSKSFDYLPAYMKIPSFDCVKYKRMTSAEWNNLKLLDEASNKLNLAEERKSSVQFDEFSASRSLSQNSKRNSILKESSVNSQQYNEINQEHNALFTIQEKCREAITNMKVDSILRMLCDDDSYETAAIPSSHDQKMN